MVETCTNRKRKNKSYLETLKELYSKKNRNNHLRSIMWSEAPDKLDKTMKPQLLGLDRTVLPQGLS